MQLSWDNLLIMNLIHISMDDKGDKTVAQYKLLFVTYVYKILNHLRM